MTAPLKILSASEPWAEYRLEDGTLLRFRVVFSNFRATGKRTDAGDPEYSFSNVLQCETHAAPVIAEVHAFKPAFVAPEQDVG